MLIEAEDKKKPESTPAVGRETEMKKTTEKQQETSGEYVVIRMDGTLEKHAALRQPHTRPETRTETNHAVNRALTRCVNQRQTLVDGTFERLTIKTATGAILMYVNEDGKDRKLPVNPIASLLIQKYIVGDVFFGAASKYGDGLTPDQINELERSMYPLDSILKQMPYEQLDAACRKLYDRSKAQYAASVEELKRQRPDCHVIAGADTTPYVPPVN